MENTEDKFLDLYEKYKNLVLKVIFNITGDFHTAQDLCQETFVKLYGYQDHVVEEKAKSWLVVVASHMAYDHLKSSGKRREFPVDLREEPELNRTEDTVDSYLDKMEKRKLCSNVLTALREKNMNWYEVLILVEYLNVPRKVVAKNRHVSLSMIDSYLRRSKKWMKEKFQKEYEQI